MWAALTLAATLSLTPAQAGGLQLTNDRVTYGILGPVRTDKRFIPGDTLFLSFDIEGLKKENGRLRYGMRMEFLDAKGRAKFTSNPEERDIIDVLGGTRVPLFAYAFLGLDAEPGEYTLRLTINDALGKQSKTLERKFEIAPRDFGLVGVNNTIGGSTPAAAVVVVGQPLVVNFGVAGFQRDAKTRQPSVKLEMTVLDESGKPTTTQSISEVVNKNVDEKISILPGAFDLALVRAGKFTVELKATDQLQNKTSTVTLPLTIVEPPK